MTHEPRHPLAPARLAIVTQLSYEPAGIHTGTSRRLAVWMSLILASRASSEDWRAEGICTGPVRSRRHGRPSQHHARSGGQLLRSTLIRLDERRYTVRIRVHPWRRKPLRDFRMYALLPHECGSPCAAGPVSTRSSDYPSPVALTGVDLGLHGPICGPPSQSGP